MVVLEKGGKEGVKVEVSGKVVWGGGEQNVRRGVSRPPLSPSIQLSVPSASRTDWVQRKKVVLAKPPLDRCRDPRQAPATEGTKVPRAPPVLPVSPLIIPIHPPVRSKQKTPPPQPPRPHQAARSFLPPASYASRGGQSSLL